LALLMRAKKKIIFGYDVEYNFGFN
jgi:hypothetical protein